MLAKHGVVKSDYSTTRVSLSPQYEYKNGVRTLRGQRASQTLRVNIRLVDSSTSKKIGHILTHLAEIDNLSIGGLSFSNSDRSTAFRTARWAAVKDAK